MLTEQQKQAVTMLAIDCKKTYEVAAALGVHRCTIWRWRKKKGFYKEWNRQIKEWLKQYQ